MIIALYKYKHPKLLKGVPASLIRWYTGSKYSHAELIIDDVWYSSSERDGGVRCKNIKLNPEKGDLFYLNTDDTSKALALEWFRMNKGKKYDYAGVARFVIPFLPNMSNRWFCFEAVGAMLGIEETDRLTGKHLEEFALKYKALS